MRHTISTAAAILLAASIAHADVTITACGQSVPKGEIGTLANDLLCDGSFAVSLGKNAKLELAGFSISGGESGVRCEEGKCLIANSAYTGGVISGMTTTGVAGIGEHGRVTLMNVTLADNLYAVVTNADFGKIDGHHLTVTGSGIGLQASKIQLAGLVASDNFRVAQARLTKLVDSTITATGDVAIAGKLVKLTRSSVSGSTVVDLDADRKPKLVEGSTCESSRDLSNPTETWGVCTND